MTEDNRRNEQRERAPTSSTGSEQDAYGHEEQAMDSAAVDRSQRHRADIADDRGLERERRSFSGEREHDELGSEMEEGGAIDSDAFDDELGGPRQSDR